MSTSVPCGGIVRDFRSRAHGKKQLPRPISALPRISVSMTGLWKVDVPVSFASGDESPRLKRSLRAMLFGVFVPPSFPFTLDDSAESERVERTDRFDSDRCRGGTC